MLAESARLKIFSNRFDEGERDAARAGELAARFELRELRASVLATRGVVAFINGDLDEARRLNLGTLDITQPGSLARFRALANLATIESAAGDYAAWQPRYETALEAATRAGDLPNLRWIQTQRIAYLVDFGGWDEAVHLIDELFGAAPAYSDRTVFLVQAAVVGARGGLDEARQLRDDALGQMGQSSEDQVVIPTLLGAAWITLIAGDDALLRELVGRVWPWVERTRYRAPGMGARDPMVAIRAGYREQWLWRAERHAVTRRTHAALLMLRGDVLEAADAWALVSPFDEAVARLYAAEVLRDRAQLERGLAFFRAVGARRIIEQAEGRLAAAAAAE
jgi:tetratricopeptide (TPR) repeat protein